VGIASMRTRVSSLGGKVDITCDGAGTVVLAVFPLID
jgi:signal transduction histidine kinase